MRKRIYEVDVSREQWATVDIHIDGEEEDPTKDEERIKDVLWKAVKEAARNGEIDWENDNLGIDPGERSIRRTFDTGRELPDIDEGQEALPLGPAGVRQFSLLYSVR